MDITWLGHAGFRIEVADQVLLVDPWLRGNPVFDEARFGEAVEGATAILLSHGHGDHASTAPEIARATGAPVAAIFELANWLEETERLETIPFAKGGTIGLGEVRVTMVHATHSSSAGPDGAPVYTGGEAGFMISGEGRTAYFAGDTDVMADMALFQELHAPQIGLLPIGGHFTMDAARAAFACRKFFRFETVIPCHYRTFPLLAQSADEFAGLAAPTPVRALEVMERATF